MVKLLFKVNCFVVMVYGLFHLHDRLTSNLYLENFWQLIQAWNSYKVHLSFRKDMVCSQLACLSLVSFLAILLGLACVHFSFKVILKYIEK